jgi:hypothetical protein
MKSKSTILAIWTIALVQYATAAQYAANITRMPAQEYACDFYGTLRFEVKIPSNMSSSMYGNQLGLTLTLPKGTLFVSSSIKLLWNNAQAQLLSLGSNEVPILSAQVTLNKSVSRYSLSIIHDKSIICPFSIGQKSSILRISSSFATDMLVGQTSWNLEGQEGRHSVIQCLRLYSTEIRSPIIRHCSRRSSKCLAHTCLRTPTSRSNRV